MGKKSGIHSRKSLWKCQHCDREPRQGWCLSQAGILHQVRHVMNIPKPLHNIAGREGGMLFLGGTKPACACGCQLDCTELREQGEEQHRGKDEKNGCVSSEQLQREAERERCSKFSDTINNQARNVAHQFVTLYFWLCKLEFRIQSNLK